MKNILISTVIAGALTSAASAFSLDLSSLSGQTLGSTTVANTYGTFTVVGGGTAVVSASGAVALGANETLTIVYPSTVNFEYATIASSGATVTDNGTVQITAAANGANLIATEFSPSVPEPSSTALLGLGGVALLLRRRK